MARIEKSVDPRVKRTRQLLQQSFLELLQEKGFASVTIQDITERATINRATFYAHYTDKYMLLDATFRQQIQEVIASKLSPSSGGGMQDLRILIKVVLLYLDEFYRHCGPKDLRYLEWIVQEEVATVLLRWLKQTKKAGSSSRIPKETLASAMSWAIFGTAAGWCLDKGSLSVEEMANHILLALSEGGTYIQES
ncbi:TetR/AcrR family transcriptional regulator [Ktedonospora formicarum]|uniref:TetR/AcrR family transcriptional regulator n=1 Tax=Ktedonospora formicarum TaxID=2778364 RepID=A0A8J3HQU4_9CHLR|nr:TetR/AcrR family transcriptional regulator [Ktedonospora formicarum]GHO42137.1 TetR/AcrR family transcriptional regulator [Ktedonospora formicarum]